MTEEDMFKKTVNFEWVVEHVDEHDDIHEHDFTDNLSKDKFVRQQISDILEGKQFWEGLTPRLALVRDYGNNAEGLINRAYAYTSIVDGELVLPKETELGHKIPDKFRNQLKKVQQ